MFDTIIENGELINGRNQPRFKADVGIKGKFITAVGDLSAAEAEKRIDAAGLVVAPGFIDVHTHSDGWLLKQPHISSKTQQGFTTEFIMLDGISYAPVNEHTWRDWFCYLRPLNGLELTEYSGWQTIADYMNLLKKESMHNVETFIPYANVRTVACGFGQRFPDDYQMYEIKRQIQIGMEDGARGLSTGLDYVDECFATTDELIEACKMMAPDGIYVTHVRYALGTLEGVQEAVEIGKKARVPVHISHLKATSVEESEAILSYIDQIAVNEVDFSFDVYPYVPSSTMLQYLLPYDVWLAGPITAVAKLTDHRLRTNFNRTLSDLPLDDIFIAWVGSKANSRYQGKSLATFIADVGGTPADALCDLLISEGMNVLLVFHLGEDELVLPFLAHNKYMMGSDGIYFPNGVIHPRQYGSAGRLLGWAAREKGLFSLETAVNKMTGFPASRFGMKNRGHLDTGCYADVVIFSERDVIDKATFSDPHQNTAGIKNVLIEGHIIS